MSDHRLGPDPGFDAGMKELDRELRGIRFRERASFGAELEAQLRRSAGAAHRRRRVAPVAAVLAAIGLGLLQVGDGPWPPGAPPADASRPFLVCAGADDVAGACAGKGKGARPEPALYLTVNGTGTVLRVGRRQSSRSTVGYPQAAFECAFDAERAFCGVSARVRIAEGQQVARGPFVYRDFCCRGSASRQAGREGVLTVSGLRDAVAFVFVYEDVNVDGQLSPGDRLRLRMHPSEPASGPILYASRDDSAGQGAGSTPAQRERRMSVVVY